MKKIIISIISIILFLTYTDPISADVLVAEGSAQLIAKVNIEDERTKVLEKYLKEKNSPLAIHSKTLIETADKYQLDWRLIPAITGVESGFAKKMPKDSYNAYGWANGKISFDSWEESIEIVAKTLKEKYVDRGADSIEKIAKIYAPPSNTWAFKVKYFINDIESMPLSYNL